MRIAFFEIHQWETKYLKERLPQDEVDFHSDALTQENAGKAQSAECLSVFIYSAVSRETLSKLPSLRFVATRSTGFDHIDIAQCRAQGIRVSNVPTYGENTVAEHTFALILVLARNLLVSSAQVREGHADLEKLTGWDLQGKTIGVIGAGHIGLHVVRIARGFGMRVVVADARQNQFLAELMGFRYVPLDELLAASDIVSLHCPLTPATHHLLGRAELRKMKRGALLINTARGALVDTEELAEALESGHLSGAGLDVLEGEEFIREEKQLLHERRDVAKLRTAVRNHILLSRQNVVFTPHNAFNSREALIRILDTTLANLEAYRRGAPVNLVDAGTSA